MSNKTFDKIVEQKDLYDEVYNKLPSLNEPEYGLLALLALEQLNLSVAALGRIAEVLRKEGAFDDEYFDVIFGE
jgi:hypothetical protein